MRRTGPETLHQRLDALKNPSFALDLGPAANKVIEAVKSLVPDMDVENNEGLNTIQYAVRQLMADCAAKGEVDWLAVVSLAAAINTSPSFKAPGKGMTRT